MKAPGFSIGIVLLLGTGCASTPQTDAVLGEPAGLPASRLLTEVPFVAQGESEADIDCGPASLAMVGRWAGIRDLSAADLVSGMITPGKRGTLQADFTGAARRSGLIAIPLRALRDILMEVSQGAPVVVFQNLGSSANPLWHYAVAVGYDLRDETLTLHSGRHRLLTMDLAQFERTWTSAGEWALLVLPPGRLSATASPAEQLLASSALEKTGQHREASRAYRAFLSRWPENAGAWFGLGNALADQGELRESIAAFEHALERSPGNEAILHNLSEVRRQLKKQAKPKKP